MSYAKHRARRDRKTARTNEAKSLSNKIRQGVFPRYFLAKAGEGTPLLERAKGGGLTMRLIGTYKTLLELSPKETKNESPTDQPASEVPNSS